MGALLIPRMGCASSKSKLVESSQQDEPGQELGTHSRLSSHYFTTPSVGTHEPSLHTATLAANPHHLPPTESLPASEVRPDVFRSKSPAEQEPEPESDQPPLKPELETGPEHTSEPVPEAEPQREPQPPAEQSGWFATLNTSLVEAYNAWWVPKDESHADELAEVSAKSTRSAKSVKSTKSAGSRSGGVTAEASTGSAMVATATVVEAAPIPAVEGTDEQAPAMSEPVPAVADPSAVMVESVPATAEPVGIPAAARAPQLEGARKPGTASEERLDERSVEPVYMEKSIGLIEKSRSRTKLRRQPISGDVVKKHPSGILPTRATLLPDSQKIKNFKPRTEWDTYNEEELNILVQISKWLGEDVFAQIPQDQLTCFLRGYAYKPDWAETSYVELHENIEWRKQVNADGLLASPPPRRKLFEQLNQGGPIGRDGHGHVVELVRIGKIEVSKLFKNFDVDEILRHIMYVAEAKRAYCIANSMDRGTRLTKTVVVVDCAGLGTGHLQKNFVTLMKKTNDVLSGHYPETMFKTYVINGPFVLRACWNIVKPMLHPITVAKFTILGSGWEKIFERDGIVLDGGAMPTTLSWTDAANDAMSRYSMEVSRTCPSFHTLYIKVHTHHITQLIPCAGLPIDVIERSR